MKTFPVKPGTLALAFFLGPVLAGNDMAGHIAPAPNGIEIPQG